MKNAKPPLSTEEKQILTELLEISDGMGRMKEFSFLNSRQMGVIQNLKKKGYVMITKLSFMVILPP
jgi:hypothetical protein